MSKKIEQDWNRLVTAWRTLAQEHRERMSGMMVPMLFAHITDLRRADNRGIDFVIRRLKASDEYRDKIRLYGGPSSDYAKCSPLRCSDSMFGKGGLYLLVRVKDDE